MKLLMFDAEGQSEPAPRLLTDRGRVGRVFQRRRYDFPFQRF